MGKQPPNLRVIGQEAPRLGLAEYIWTDTTAKGRDLPELRSASRVILVFKDEHGTDMPHLDAWALNDLDLSPCQFLPDPRRPQPAWLVLCEARMGGRAIGARADLRRRLADRGDALDVHLVVRVVQSGLTAAVAERWLLDCLDAGILTSGLTKTKGGDVVLLLGHRGFGPDIDPYPPGPLIVADHTHLARHLLERAHLETGPWEAPSDAVMELSLTTKDLRNGRISAYDLVEPNGLLWTTNRNGPLQIDAKYSSGNAHVAVQKAFDALLTSKVV